MDTLVPVIIYGTFLVLCLLGAAGLRALVRKVRLQGWSALLPRLEFAAWNRFWFSPADPTVLGAIRILCGAITTYTMFAYTFMLQDFVGKDSWYDLHLRLEVVRSKPNLIGALMVPYGRDYADAVPSTKAEEKYKKAYKDLWGVYPPPPFPTDLEREEQALTTITDIVQDPNTGTILISTAAPHGLANNDPVAIRDVKGATTVNGAWYVVQAVSERAFAIKAAVLMSAWTGGGVAGKMSDLDAFKMRFGYDLRQLGLRPPRTAEDWQYVNEYMEHPANFSKRPPPAYPTNAKEKQEIYDFMSTRGGIDPRLAYSMGVPAWSIWFHVTDPAAMNVIHALVVVVAFLFTIGLCTRVTSVLTWITVMWYIHRNPILLFGVDTMMVILLLYLMIGPSGAALSVDRLIARWWSQAKPRVVKRWRTLLGRPALPEGAIQPAFYSPAPVPSVSANFAIRMVQVHLCIIYFVSGISKLQGGAWWGGTAVWGTLANYEFAPMAFEIGRHQVYTEFLRWLGGRQLLLDAFLSGACLATVAFEISYLYLIWRPSLRWVFLAGAIALHGFIGVLMGLKTFSFMMLALNMAFLHQGEIDKALSVIGGFFRRIGTLLGGVGDGAPFAKPQAAAPLPETLAKR